MEYKFHLIFVKNIAIDEDPKAPTLRSESDVPKKYLTVQSIVEFDTFTATHGPGTYLDSKFLFVNYISKAKILWKMFLFKKLDQTNENIIQLTGQQLSIKKPFIQHILYQN